MCTFNLYYDNMSPFSLNSRLIGSFGTLGLVKVYFRKLNFEINCQIHDSITDIVTFLSAKYSGCPQKLNVHFHKEKPNLQEVLHTPNEHKL